MKNIGQKLTTLMVCFILLGITLSVGITIAITSNDLSQETLWRVILSIVPVTIIFTAFTAYIMFLNVRNLVNKPISHLIDLTSNAANGNFNYTSSVDNIPKDEIGRLTIETYSFIGVFAKVVDEIRAVTNEFNDNGDYEHRINTSGYSGSIKDMVEAINTIADSYESNVLELLNALSEISNGNLNIEIKRHPGKKEILNKHFDDLINTIKNVRDDLAYLVNSASKEHLSVRLDDSKYNGEWFEIIKSFNGLMEAIESPIQEANEVMGYAAVGDFDRKMSGIYSGDFLTLKNSINNTISSMTQYIDEIYDLLGALANHDLDLQIRSEYVGKFSNIKDALSNITTQFNIVIADINSTANHVDSLSKIISDGSKTLASGSVVQASSIETLTETIQAINKRTEQQDEGTRAVETLSEQLKDHAVKGSTNMDQMLISMDGIIDSSNKITNIAKVIEDIAFQTNLLALNATVEASHAGVYGKGFSVVADEVRSLAAKCQVSAKETALLIEECIERVSEGKENANQTAGTLQVIVDEITQVAAIIKSIASVSEEQSDALGKITLSVSKILDVMLSNSESSETTSSASHVLSVQSDTLKETVRLFELETVLKG